METMRFDLKNGAALEVSDASLNISCAGRLLFSFALSSPCDVRLPDGSVAADGDGALFFLGSEEREAYTRLSWRAENGRFDEKEYVVRVYGDHLTYRIRLRGKAALEQVRFFGGGDGTKYFVSGYFDCQADYHTEQTAHYLMGRDRALQPYLFSPPPYVYPFWNEMNDRVVSVGLADRPGRNNYFRWEIKFRKPQKTWFELPYFGREEVDGEWESPAVRIAFADEEWQAVREYARWAAETFDYPAYEPKNAPDWWRKPIFCGWNEQYNLWKKALAEGRRADTKDFAAQEYYEEMLSRLDRVGLKPGAVIIDDMWQTDYGTNEVDTDKWPDMRAFVDAQHKKGRRVMLWWRLWNCDGLPARECMKADGLSVCADPSSPEYRERICDIVHKLLSDAPGCMNCDGFKLDYIYRFPQLDDREARPRDPSVYGLELMRIYYKTIYDAVKRVKPDACVSTSLAHPYFADVFDVIRLHDYSSVQRSTVSMMEFRAKTVRSVFPGAIVDTDGANSFTGDPQEVLFHNERACKVGVPALYAISNLSDDDLREIGRVWNEYENSLE